MEDWSAIERYGNYSFGCVLGGPSQIPLKFPVVVTKCV